MDQLETPRKILTEIIHRYAGYLQKSKVDVVTICDPESDSYMLMRLGWSQTGRVYATPIHVRLKDNKFWIEWDGTEYSIAQELMDAGVPKESIVLAFHNPETRQQMNEFAVA